VDPAEDRARCRPVTVKTDKRESLPIPPIVGSFAWSAASR
jgi:hypothetical protein